MTAPAVTDSALLAAYVESDHEQRVRISRVGCILALVLVPLFWGLDWLVYPPLAWSLLWTRLLCAAAVAVVFALLVTGFGRRWIRLLGVAWAICPGVAIAWMVYATEGEHSPYYAGLNLTMIAVVLLMPWTAIEVALLCALIIGMYIVGCVLHSPDIAITRIPFFTNLYFLGATAAICTTAGFFASRRRYTDFCLRHELAQRNRDMAEMDRLKTEFYANVSHELRTPLTLILAPLESLMNNGTFDRQTRTTLTMMRDNALRLLRLINDILDIVRLDSGHLVLRRSRRDLATYVTGIVESVRHLAESKHLELSLSTDDPVIAVDVDPSMMEKVLLNLLSNAIKFTPDGGRIAVAWGHRDQRAWVSVKDSGIGIAATDLPRLFQRFQQVDSSATRGYRGMGLGLSLARDLVERHGGTLVATSEPGKGSTFRFELPPGGAAAPVVEAAVDESTHNEFIQRTYREADRSGIVATADDLPLETILEPLRAGGASPDLVLIADDEPDMRRFLVSIVREHHRVVAVGDGERAVALARELRPQLALLDLMMPKLDGMQTCHALRADERTLECRIVLLTARADDETRINALEGGADDFLTKPFSTQEVQSRVRNLLDGAALQRDLRARNVELEDTLRRLRQAESMLVQSEKMNALGSLASGLLHEINNPLNYAMSAVDYARSALIGDDPALTDVMKDIHEGMQRISDIITSLRLFAYPSAVSLDEPFAVSEVVAVCLRFTANLCDGMTVTQRLAPSAKTCGSATQISMVLVNLVSNAAKAIRKCGRPGEIIISAETKGDRLHLTVADNADGMTPEQVRRAFDPFYTTNEVGQGMGLGLAICHTIVRNHHGEIRIDSQPGVGTTITLDLIAPSLISTGVSHGP